MSSRVYRVVRLSCAALVAAFAILLFTPLAHAQIYQGEEMWTNVPGSQPAAIVFDLNMNPNGDGPINGYMGASNTVPANPAAMTPISGTKRGNICTVTVTGQGGGAVFTGTCDSQSFTGTFTVGNQTGTFKASTWSAAGCRTPTPPVAPPDPTPLPNPRPLPPTPLPPPNPTPVPPPPPVQTGPVRYCGTFNNTTYHITGPMEIDLKTANSFTGAIMIVGGAKNAANMGTFGGGQITGTWAGNCSGSSTGGVKFTGTCSASTINASYTIQGQAGSFTLTAGAACQ